LLPLVLPAPPRRRRWRAPLGGFRVARPPETVRGGGRSSGGLWRRRRL